MLNVLWTAMLLLAIVAGALTGRLDAVGLAAADGAGAAITLIVGLVGTLVLWLGLMHVLHAGGLLAGLGRTLTPLLRRLLPSVPAEHPALAAVALNVTANMLGLGNAATPFGLRAMEELATLGRRAGVITDAMVVFLVLNTAGLTMLPTSMVALRAGLGSRAPGAIILPTIVATLCAAAAGLVAARLLGSRRDGPADAGDPAASTAGTYAGVGAAASAPSGVAPLLPAPELRGPARPRQAALAGIALAAALAWALQRAATVGLADGAPLGWGGALRHGLGSWALATLIVALVLLGYGRGVRVYDAAIAGGREGLQVAQRLAPTLVPMLVGIAMLRASGIVDAVAGAVTPLTEAIGMPAEALPMALLRPFTGAGAYAVAADIMRAHGPDSRVGQVVSTLMGSTETLFYVLALYCGAVRVQHTRHLLACCLVGDVVGTLAAVWSCRLLLG